MRSINNIVVPQGLEYQAVCRGLQKANAKVRVIAIPIGDRNPEAVLANYSQQLVDGGVLVMGLCGSLCESYRVGDVVVVKSCGNLDRDYLNLDDELTTIIQNKLSVDAVRALTSDRVITRSTEKLKLAREYRADIVDMEGYGYISYLQQRAVAMLRVVSDDVKGDIPDLTRAIDEGGQLKTIPLAIALCKQPIAATRLIRGSLTSLKVLQQITTRLFTS